MTQEALTNWLIALTVFSVTWALALLYALHRAEQRVEDLKEVCRRLTDWLYRQDRALDKLMRHLADRGAIPLKLYDEAFQPYNISEKEAKPGKEAKAKGEEKAGRGR